MIHATTNYYITSFNTLKNTRKSSSNTPSNNQSPCVRNTLEKPTKTGGLGEANYYLPNAIIVGCAKCGTRALLWFLSFHPDVKTVNTETHFFDTDTIYEKGLSWYGGLFESRRQNQIGIEKTPAYFMDDKVPRRIHNMNSSIKLLFIVCEPVRKAISQYTQLLHNEKNTESFERRFFEHGVINSYHRSVKEGMYHENLQRWLKWFPLKQMMFVDGDRFKVDPSAELRIVEDFLHIQHFNYKDIVVYNQTKGFFCIFVREVRCLDDNKGRPHPYVDPELKQKLADYYRPHNHKFSEFVGRFFDWDVWN